MNLQKLSEDITKGINEAIVNASLPQQYFILEILPKFLANVANETFVLKWTEFAGGPQRVVELTDDQGNVVDIVPPIIGLQANPDSVKSNIRSSIMQANARDGLFGTGDSFLINELQDSLGGFTGNEDWAGFLNRYINLQQGQFIEDNIPLIDDMEDSLEIVYE